MSSTAISPGKMARYRATAHQRATDHAAELDARYARAWHTAQKAARLLHKKFGADRVVLFGSLLRRERFYERSDIDLAAWGIAERTYLHAVSALLDLDPEFSFDLVRMEETLETKGRESLVKTIRQEGQTL